MTVAPPAHAPLRSVAPLPSAVRPDRLPPASALAFAPSLLPASPAGREGAAPLAAYLVLLPADADPADLFARAGLTPHIQAVPFDPPPGPAAPHTAATAPAPHPDRGPVSVDPARHVAEVDGVPLDLTYLEFGLLARLVDRPGQVHSREQLVRGVWGHEYVGDGRTVDVHVARLRRKLGAAHRHCIVTVRRVGYKYVAQD